MLAHFAEVADPARYAPLPDDWAIGVSDVVDSTAAITAGRYKAVNLAGAATISAVSNRLGGDLDLFIFGGDGARFAVPATQGPAAADALSRVAMWAKRDLDLDLRVGMTSVGDARAAGFDVRVAFWRASDHVRYAMFSGGGLEWAEAQLKSDAINLTPAEADQEPDLTGLSCQWGPIRTRRGKILSLIVKPARGAATEKFAAVVAEAIAVLGDGPDLNPIPAAGPEVDWPGPSMGLQARVADRDHSLWWRRIHVAATAAAAWAIFKLGLRVGDFAPDRYRREIAFNTDFRKFDDALMMTVDCAPDVAEKLRALLDAAATAGIVRFGLHLQDEALMTCVVPSVSAPDHLHFVDGAGGGYAAAARQLRQRAA
jgi:hypothetical protein